MVIGAFPVAKLGALLLKQISKPIANAVKNQAKEHPIFRKYVCMPPAQFYNWCEIQTKMWILNLGKPVNIPVLNEAMAIELGANLLGEGIIFIIAAAILISEYSRSSRKETAKEEAKQAEIQQLQSTLIELYMQTEQQAAQIRELNRYLLELDSSVVKKPWVGHKDIEPQPPPNILPIIPIIETNEDSVKEEDDKRPKPPPPINEDSVKEKDDKRSKPPPPPMSPTNEDSVKEDGKLEPPQDKMTKHDNISIVLKAINNLEEELWKSEPRQNNSPSLLKLAINHLYKDVYKLPLTIQ